MQQPGDIQLRAIINRVKQRMATLPRKAGDTAVLFSKQRFKEQAWAGVVSEPWKKRKPGAKRNKGRALLVSSGRLRRSIRIKSTTATTATIGSDVPYAKAHNEGLRGPQTVGAHMRKGKPVTSFTRNANLPRRQFMGASPYLDKQIKRLVAAELAKALKQ